MKIILLVLLVIPLSITSQIKDSLNIEFESQTLEKYDLLSEKYEGDTYTKICTSNIPKMLKYSNAKAWIAKTFGNYQSVVQLEDQESCKIILKGLLELTNEIEIIDKVSNVTVTPTLNFMLTIDCKDDKFRLKFENMRIDMLIASNPNPLYFETYYGKDSKKISEYIKIESTYGAHLGMQLVEFINSAITSIGSNDDDNW